MYLKSLFCAALLCVSGFFSTAILTATESPAAPWPVVEHELHYAVALENPFRDIQATAVYNGPAGTETVKLEGFYAGGDTWRFRFVSRSAGAWKAELSLARDGRTVATRSVEFTVEEVAPRGFFRVSRTNCYRFEFENGEPFYPVGIQPCGHDSAGLDGPPAGQGHWRSVSMEEFLATHRGAENLFRIQLGQGTTAGCAWQVMADSLHEDRYGLAELNKLDALCRLLRANDFSVMLIMFQDMSLWGTAPNIFGDNRDLSGWKNPSDTRHTAAVEQYLRYMVARFGAYVDVWELFNEDAWTPDARLAQMAACVRGCDPYRHPVTTTYERPSQPWCDLVTVHEYMWLPPNQIDQHLTHEFARFKSFGKPVLYTEFGNQGELSNRDPVKWRIAVWTAFMNESSLLFWSMGGVITPDRDKPVRGNSNAYLGPEARQYFRVFHCLTDSVPLSLRPVMTGFGQLGDEVRRYGLSNGELSLVYLQHYTSHASAAKAEVYVWTGDGKFSITWIDPSTGETVARDQAQTPGQVLIVNSPEFKVDLVARIERLGGVTQ